MIKLFCVLTLISISSACSHHQRDKVTVATYHNPSMCTSYCYSNCVVYSQHEGLNVESYICDKPDPYGRDTVCKCTLIKCVDV